MARGKHIFKVCVLEPTKAPWRIPEFRQGLTVLKCTCVPRRPCGLLVFLGEAACIYVGACSFLFSLLMTCDDEGHMNVGMCEPVDMNMCALA